jgi:hypothetical protein
MPTGLPQMLGDQRMTLLKEVANPTHGETLNQLKVPGLVAITLQEVVSESHCALALR